MSFLPSNGTFVEEFADLKQKVKLSPIPEVILRCIGGFLSKNIGVLFSKIFIQHPDGTFEPRQRIKVDSVEFRPGVRFSRGVTFSGVDFTQFIGHDLEVEIENDVLVIKGIY